MTTKLARIAEVARRRPKERFTSLIHLIDADMLRMCHTELKANKAAGVDGITKGQYEGNLEANIQNLLERLKRKSYRPQPVRRVYIPKPGTDQKRPLGIPAYEDKVVQLAISKILNAIFEADFLEMSFGFRPQRGCHDALKLLNYLIVTRKVNYIVDADIKGFFDHVDHDWLMKFLEHRIADPNFLRLIRRFLKAGIMENGELRDATEGTPQGGIISPILANIYLHYVLDLWFEKVVRKHCRGEAYIVRYADDFICCFQYKHEAEAFYRALRTRLAKFSLSVAEEKTKIIPFGRFAAQWCKRMGKKKPDTFDFLGFTHYCSTSHQGKFRVKRRTSRKKFRQSVQRMKEWIKANRMLPAKALMGLLRLKLEGYYRYYGITDNSQRLQAFHHIARCLLFKWLNRRSQRKSFDGEKFERFLEKYPLPSPGIYVNIMEIRLPSAYIA